MYKIASAIAAGTILLLSQVKLHLGCHILAEVIHETSMPKGMFNMIHGHGAVVGRAMSTHPDLKDFIHRINKSRH